MRLPFIKSKRVIDAEEAETKARKLAAELSQKVDNDKASDTQILKAVKAVEECQTQIVELKVDREKRSGTRIRPATTGG
jgi:capsular polysaccharide biosynthesis protein